MNTKVGIKFDVSPVTIRSYSSLSRTVFSDEIIFGDASPLGLTPNRILQLLLSSALYKSFKKPKVEPLSTVSTNWLPR